MSFESYMINESDYNFFSELPGDEKILFLYDLICDKSYGTGSSDEFYEDKKLLPSTATFDQAVQFFKDKLQYLVESTISTDVLVNILFINNYVVFNSESKSLLDEAVSEIAFDGYILREKQLTIQQLPVFHHQRYCKVYEIIGREQKISTN